MDLTRQSDPGWTCTQRRPAAARVRMSPFFYYYLYFYSPAKGLQVLSSYHFNPLQQAVV